MKKNRRILMINIHLVLASLFMPFMLILPLSGGLYLLDIKGEQTKTELFKIPGPIPEPADDFFREQFKAHDIKFRFESIRANDKEFLFRPTANVHYVATRTGDGVTVSEVNPDWIRRFMEIHKGHGPMLLRWIEVGYALALILVTLSGVYLAWTIPVYRRFMGISFALGALVIALVVII